MNSDKPERPSDEPNIQEAAALLVRKIARSRGLRDGVADDLQQAVSIKLLSLTQERLKSIENLEAYLAKVVLNEANRLQSNTPQAEVPLEDIDYSDHFEFQRRLESWIILQEVWKKLDSDERSLFRLLFFDYNEKEVAIRLNISHAAARKRVSRFRQKLEGLLMHHFSSDPPANASK